MHQAAGQGMGAVAHYLLFEREGSSYACMHAEELIENRDGKLYPLYPSGNKETEKEKGEKDKAE